MANALGWIQVVKMEVVVGEEPQGQIQEAGFPLEQWKQVAGAHQLQEGRMGVAEPTKKGKN